SPSIASTRRPGPSATSACDTTSIPPRRAASSPSSGTARTTPPALRPSAPPSLSRTSAAARRSARASSPRPPRDAASPRRHERSSLCADSAGPRALPAAARPSPALHQRGRLTPNSLLLDEVHQPLEGHVHPLGAVVQLVRQLVGALVQQVEIQQDLELRRLTRDERRALRRLQIPPEERRGDPALPQGAPLLQTWDVIRAQVPMLDGAHDSVVDGPQHPAHVVQRRALQAPHTEGQRGLPLEVDDVEVLARVEHLPQVVVPVAADARRLDLLPRDPAQQLIEVALRLEDPLRQGAHLVREAAPSPPQQLERRGEARPGGLIERALVQGREALRDEGLIDLLPRQSQVEFAGALG